ncbi:hypothetical protein Tco_0922469 [Tanacetum coccineum]|uniref:Retrovirus-related Pol polyprotein from transposon TNT 1-94-like beta-barrel domain-containing protein n=1 Tax=Tanacetum coccineum TaxID=301880 RepID=A0ABQ5CZF7_9ASTR
MSRDVITIGSTMRILLLYQGEYSQWSDRFMNYLEEQTDGEAMINSIKNGEHLLPVTAEEKRNQKIDRLARSLLIQGLPNDIYSLIDSNNTAKELWDALEIHMRGCEYGEQDRKAVVLYEYETFKATEGELLLDTYIRYLQVINDLKKYGYKKDNCDVNEAMSYKKKAVVVTSDPLALVVEKIKVTKSREKVIVQSDSEGSDDEDIIDLKKITALLAKAFNWKNYYTKPMNNNLRTTSVSTSANKKPKKAKVKDYNYYNTKMLLAKKDNDEQVLLAEDQAWMKSSSDSDQEINVNMVFMAKIEKVLSDSEESSSSAEETIVESEVDHNESEDQNHLINKLIAKFNQKIAKCQKHIKKANQQSKDLENQNKALQDTNDVLKNQVNTFEEKSNEFNEQSNALNEKNDDLLAQTEILNSGCSKHMTVNRAVLTNFVEKFLRTVRFGNDDFAVITGYGDMVIGLMTIKKVYYVEDLGHSLFSVRQFYDKGLEVAFRKSTCFIRTEDGVDFLTGYRSSNLYTIVLNDIISNSSVCLLAKASSSQS